jgi:plasmid stabilization system protein ParE
VNLVVSPEALADLHRLREFLATRNAGAADRATDALSRAIGSLAGFPDRGRLSAIDAVRELLVRFGRSAYVIRYAHEVELETIVVLRVWHSREDR